MSDGLSKIPVHTWLTGGIVLASIVGGWAVMNYQLELYESRIGNIENNTIPHMQHDIRLTREEIDALEIRSAVEDAADQLLDLRVQRLEEHVGRNGGH